MSKKLSIVEQNTQWLGKVPFVLSKPLIGEKRGFYIGVEGIDGSGKGKQVELLQQALEKTGFKVSVVREPGSTKIGEQIRDILKDPNNNKLTPEAELLLMNAARSQLITEKIKPLLDSGFIVISDRCFWSSLIYQGMGRGLDLDIVKATTQLAVKEVVPDTTFVLYLKKGVAEERKQARGTTDRFELANQEFKDRIAKGYEWLCSQEIPSKRKIIAIDSGGTLEAVHNEIYRCVAARISELPANRLELASQIIKL